MGNPIEFSVEHKVKDCSLFSPHSLSLFLFVTMGVDGAKGGSLASYLVVARGIDSQRKDS